jgi:hypothetical protein
VGKGALKVVTDSKELLPFCSSSNIEEPERKVNTFEDKIKFLERKFSIARWFSKLTEGGRMVKYSTMQRGNSAYCYEMDEKLLWVGENLQNKGGSGLFVTVTYAPGTHGKDRLKSWKLGQAELRKCKRKLKRLGFIYQMGCNEATAQGYFHAHLIISDGKTVHRHWVDKKGKWRLCDEKLRAEIKKKWGLGFTDIEVIKDYDGYNYVRKYCGKGGNAERAIKDYKELSRIKKLTKEESKRLGTVKKIILTHYYASEANCRLCFYTQNISATKWIKTLKKEIKELSIQADFRVLFCSENNVTRQRKVKIIELGKETINSIIFTKQVGQVDPDTQEYKMLMALFDKVPWHNELEIVKRSETERLADEELEDTA